MGEHYDSLETRDPAERQQILIQAVSKQVAHAKIKSAVCKTLLANVDPDEVTDIGAIATITGVSLAPCSPPVFARVT